MNASIWSRTLALACAAALGSGCNLDGLGAGIGCGLREGLRGLGDSLNRAFGGGTETLRSDDDAVAGEVYCGRDDCELRDVLYGSSLTMQLQLVRGDERAAAGADFEFESTAPDVLVIDGFEPMTDTCHNVFALGELHFQGLGGGAMVVRNHGAEIMRFTYRVHEAASLTIAVPESQLDNRVALDGETLRGPAGAFATIGTDVRNADGVRLSTGGQARFWVDDPAVAELTLFSGGLGATGDGPTQTLALMRPGSTRVHALVANVQASLTVEVTDRDRDDGGVADDDGGTEGEQP